MIDPSYFSYVIVMSATPGPNNVMLASSGVNFGLRRTLPMVWGVVIGCALQLLISTLAFELLMQWMGSCRLPLTIIGGVYLLWLSWKVFRSSAPATNAKAAPMSLIEAIVFQALNPKAWLMCLNVTFVYAADESLCWLLGSYALLTLPCVVLWAILGARLSLQLQVTWKRALFNSVMACTLAMTAVWMMIEAVLLAS